MTPPQIWLDRTQQEVAKLLADYPALGNEGNAFNVWALQALHDLTEDEALEAAASRLVGPGDGGIDAIVSDDASQVLYLVQSKFSAGMSATYDETAVQELFGGLDLLLSEAYSSAAGTHFLAAREQLLGAMSGGSDIVLEVVLAGRMTAEGRDRAVAYLDSLNLGQVRLEVVDVDDLWRLHSDRSQGEDLSDEWVSLDVLGSLLEIPGQPAGLTGAYVAVLDAASLVPAVAAYGRRLVAGNLRHLLKTSRINDSIAKSTTTKDLRERFPLLNNGLTITCGDIEQSEGHVRLLNPQIVNGGQTTMTLYQSRANFAAGDIHLIARIIATTEGEAGRKLALEIAEATNRQNPITPGDLKANDDRQKKIQSLLAAVEPPWFYERRRNERASLAPGRLSQYAGVITKEDLGQRWRAFQGAPAAAITGKQNMFLLQDLYGETFPDDVDPRHFVLAHQLFELFYEMLGASSAAAALRQSLVPQLTEPERVELIRARNQWAAHCVAVTAHVLKQEYGDVTPALSARLTTELRGAIRQGHGDFRGLLRLVAVSVHKWFKGRKDEAQSQDRILALKAEFERPSSFPAQVSEVESYQALLAGIPEYAMPPL